MFVELIVDVSDGEAALAHANSTNNYHFDCYLVVHSYNLIRYGSYDCLSENIKKTLINRFNWDDLHKTSKINNS